MEWELRLSDSANGLAVFNYFYELSSNAKELDACANIDLDLTAMSEGNAMSRKQLTSGTEAAFLFAHQTNIEKYKKILATDLTDHERSFVQWRLAEERTALKQFARV
jgi:hypothetical protein